MKRYITFGEIMLRLKPPNWERYFQSPLLEATFGGGEANVAVGLARFGLNVAYISVIPNNPIGDACIRELKKTGCRYFTYHKKGKQIGYLLSGGRSQSKTL